MPELNVKSTFEDIYESTNHKILIYIIAKCGKTSDIDDIFQETYLELYRVIDQKGIKYITNQEAFVMKLAKQKIYRYYTLLDKLRRFSSLDNERNDNSEESLYLDIRELEDDIADHLMLEQINQEIKTKSEKIQKIFYLYYSMDLTLSEIAKELNMTESNVKHKLYRTLNQIRDSIKEGKDHGRKR